MEKPPEGKICSLCKEFKPLDQYHANTRRKSGLQHYCKKCSRKRQNDLYKKDRSKVIATIRKYKLKIKYGITPEQYDDIIFIQNGLCGICKCILKREDRPNIDHDHTTGKVRGILCFPCNVALGHYEARILKYKEEFDNYLNNNLLASVYRDNDEN